MTLDRGRVPLAEVAIGDREHAVLTYRGRGVELELPTLCSPSWFAGP